MDGDYLVRCTKSRSAHMAHVIRSITLPRRRSSRPSTIVPRRPLPELEALGRRAEGRQEHQSRAGHGPLQLPEGPDEPGRRGAVFQVDAPGRLPREEHPEVDYDARDRERRGGEPSTVGARRHPVLFRRRLPFSRALRAAPGVVSYLQSQSQSDSQTTKARVGRRLRPTVGVGRSHIINPESP